MSAGERFSIEDGIEMVQSMRQYNANACSYDSTYVCISIHVLHSS